MLLQPVEIHINKIEIVCKYYPRVEPDESRIKEFTEAMEYGEHFPPIKVVKVNDGYILLDGLHRLKARLLRGEEKIEADILSIAEEYWLLAAARFNSKSSKPLTSGELKEVIITTWQSGLRDTKKIGEEMGCTPRYVEKIVKPLRDKECRKREEKILELHDMGLSQRDIAAKTGAPLSRVNKTIKSSEINENSIVFSKRTEFVLRTLGQKPINTSEPLVIGQSQENHLLEIAENTPQDSAGVENNNEKEPEPINSVTQANSYPTYLGQIGFYNELPAKEKHAARTLELVKKYKLNLIDIIDIVSESIDWLRKVLIVAISLAIISGDLSDKIMPVADSAGMSYETAFAIKEFLAFEAMCKPIGPHMKQWCDSNLSGRDIGFIVKSSGIQKKDLPYLLKGDPPPKKVVGFEILPDSYKDRLRTSILLFREIRDHAKKDKFHKTSAKQLLTHLNRNRVAINEIYDAMRENDLLG